MMKDIRDGIAVALGGKAGGNRYYDLVMGNANPKQETKTGEEIALEVIAKAGLEVV